MDMQLFGRKEPADAFQAEDNKALLTKTLHCLSEPFVISSLGGLPEIKWQDAAGGIINPQHAAAGFTEFVTRLANMPKSGYINCLVAVSVKDEDWGAWRNKRLTGEYYYKLTLKPEIQKRIAEEIRTALSQFNAVIAASAKADAERNRRRAAWRIAKVYRRQRPSGGENGRDGLLDADIENTKTGKVTRFIIRNVFDFGYYTYPFRLDGTDDIFKRDIWTDEERHICSWLNEFPPMTAKTRM